MSASDTALILGAGPRVGSSVAKKFASEGYAVVIASRSVQDGSTSPEGYLQVKVDLDQPRSVRHAFESVMEHFQAPPNVVVFNGAHRLLNPPDDPFSTSLESFHACSKVGFESQYVAAQEAVKGFKTLPESVPKTFIFTGNALNQVPIPQVFPFALSKRLSATVIEYGANAYGSKGYRFYYADERKPGDGRPAGEDIDGEAHAEMYWQLAQPGLQEPWLVTFGKGEGRVPYGGVGFDGVPYNAEWVDHQLCDACYNESFIREPYKIHVRRLLVRQDELGVYAHELTQTNFEHKLLDPAIPIGDEPLIVADVATGTGVWALEVAERFPNLTIEGLDINLNETPPKAWLPSNVTFREFNLLEDIPEELVERYDIVHVQFVMIFVLDSNVHAVIQRLLRMLKPGGYLQWTDSNSNRYSWHTATTGQEPTEVIKLYTMAQDIVGKRSQNLKWLNNFEDLFKRSGLKDVEYVAPESRPSTLQPVMMNWIWALEEGFGHLRMKVPERAQAIDEWMEQRKRALQEIEELKVGMNMRTQRCIGRKPVS
ncbi:hypothetical protein M409DRAFT_23074 [Zasmidium cellare ATCC 36951]|uniref:Methyltransferase domain-containing protein n=1 Tax=Zasmidium cellare ATCC 36951 TaxID=1080233 RepID=A0A6A6CKE8_ZASCE|nr:uncharacterized protein M409DRAFT_23074 [Zasmidium cellare ATCC 36951]KAF2166432.1 hypothetical protein M409DRAFT_23074 [Zasmidium cellare ATCC 36951]